jgi:O-antigen/teichoic acid export membrane protein
VGQVSASTKESWGLGKWLFAAQIITQVQIYIPYWLTVAVAGAGATGVYAACMSIVAFANPLIVGLGNTLMPRAVLAWNQVGAARLRRQAIQDALLLGAMMTSFSVLVLFAGDDVMRWLYHGKDYEGQGPTITMLALALLAAAVGMPASNALASMERPHAIVWTGAIGAAVTAVLVWYLMPEWGLLGAAYGALAGNIAGAVGRWITFLALVSRAVGPLPISANDHSRRPKTLPDSHKPQFQQSIAPLPGH